jgi:Spy/CpxP family protein refolding chaperone
MNSLSKPFRLTLATAAVAIAGLASQTAFAAPADGPMGGGMGGHGTYHGMHHGMGDGGGMRGGMNGGMNGGMSGRHLGRMLDAVNATPEQRSQIKTIMDTAHKDLAAQHESGRKLHEQSQSVFTQPNIDARAAETLRQQMLAQHDAASKRMLQAMLDASKVLTPEQRKTLADKMAQRRGMMERHHAERRQMEAPAPK